ncbi:MAG: hypothetical protein HYX46_08905 [Betaproteobacteria bacterium]|nr:hypothetical protein [Betaproteobacteria bacterium]
MTCLLTVPLAMAQEQAVTAQEIQDEWVGKTLVGATPSGAPVTMAFNANGTVALTAGRTSDTGTWRVVDNGYCTTWKTIRAGQERCFTARRAGTKITVSNPDGSVSGYFTGFK